MLITLDAELDTGIAMKPPSFAPVYAVFFPVLAEIAQANGYALTVHGSLQKDFDLLAAPWTIEAVSAEDLMKGIADYAGQVMGMMFETSVVITQVEEKPHGRKAWCIKMGNGSVIDLSVMPRLSV